MGEERQIIITDGKRCRKKIRRNRSIYEGMGIKMGDQKYRSKWRIGEKGQPNKWKGKRFTKKN